MSEFFGLYSHPSGVLLHCFVLGVACSISHARPPFSPRPISALMLQATLSLTTDTRGHGGAVWEEEPRFCSAAAILLPAWPS